MHTLTSIHTYPIKSLAGISLNEAVVQSRGLQYDRRWMLVDDTGRFISQREIAELALLGTALEAPFLTIFSKKNPALRLQIPLEPEVAAMPEIPVQIWDDRCLARVYASETNRWFSEQLGRAVRLVYMSGSTERMADSHYAPENMPVSFADGYPFLLIGQASLDGLNGRLAQPLPMNRFRPNFVVTSGTPHEEDQWRDFRIGNQAFRGVKPCARCIIPTTDQDTASRSEEPLKTLATYRKEGRKILFGQNVIWLGTGEGRVQVGDVLFPE